jgi:hypothetical protein
MRIVGAELVNDAEESHNETGGISLCRLPDEENGPLSTGGVILLLEANPWLLVSLAFIMAEGLGGSAVLNPAG